jgi:4-oxalocrotonate tautomerase family enzyme
MPVIATIQYPEGKGPEVVKKLLVEVSNLLMKELNEPPENIRVKIKEIPLNRYAVGGVMFNEK